MVRVLWLFRLVLEVQFSGWSGMIQVVRVLRLTRVGSSGLPIARHVEATMVGQRVSRSDAWVVPLSRVVRSVQVVQLFRMIRLASVVR